MRGVVVVTAVLAMCCSDVASFSSLSQEHYRSRHTHRIIRQQILAAAGSGSGEPQQIISPFDNSAASSDGDNGSVATTTTSVSSNEILDLTYENVELVLDGMRHFLIQDGGNVIIDEIDGPIVKLQLQGNCGTCPSSTQTMKMGLERGLKERIPEIQEVIQSLPEGPPLVPDQIEIVLDGVRPFLQIVGGSIVLDRIEGLDSIQPSIILQMSGSSASLNSVKLEIAQRLQRHFMMSGLQIHWKEE